MWILVSPQVFRGTPEDKVAEEMHTVPLEKNEEQIQLSMTKHG